MAADSARTWRASCSVDISAACGVNRPARSDDAVWPWHSRARGRSRRDFARRAERVDPSIRATAIDGVWENCGIVVVSCCQASLIVAPLRRRPCVGARVSGRRSAGERPSATGLQLVPLLPPPIYPPSHCDSFNVERSDMRVSLSTIVTASTARGLIGSDDSAANAAYSHAHGLTA